MKPIKFKHQIEVVRVRSDYYGNPRFVIHWTVLDAQNYSDAIALANKLGGRKYRANDYGGGIVFQTYANCLQTEIMSILAPYYREVEQ